MPSGTGVSIQGRQVIASGLTAATTAFVRIQGADATKYLYKGTLDQEQVTSGVPFAGVTPPVKIYYNGAFVSVPAIGGGQTRNVVVFWHKAGIPFSYQY